MNIFDAVWADARRSGDKQRIAKAAMLRLQSQVKAAEIEAVRGHRDKWRTLHPNGERNGHLVTLEMHPLEYECFRFLCPDLEHADWDAKKRSWLWALRQPWGKEYRTAPFEERRF